MKGEDGEMTEFKNAMEIFKLLDKSNCRDCGEKSCLAFAGAVFLGRKQLADCPRLDRAIVEAHGGGAGKPAGIEENRDDYIEALKKEAARIDLEEAARRTGGRFAKDRLTLKILGKDFSVDNRGRLFADIHVNPWVAAPFLDYVLNGKGLAPTGKWVSFRELNEGRERYPLFQKRCEEALKKVADAYTDLFDDMVHIFGGRRVAEAFESDISVVLHPLPRVPMMICYWMPEEGIDSSLNIFFDETANENLSIGSIFSLGAGFAQMLDKLSHRHGIRAAM